jgi:hypothetical protein
MTQTDRNAHSENEDLLRFQTLLVDISTHFIDLPSDQIDQSINVAQRSICEFFDLDRSTIWQRTIHEPDRCLLTHTYQPDDTLPAFKPANTRFPAKSELHVQSADSPVYMPVDAKTDFPWFFAQVIDRGKTVIFSTHDDLPPEASHDVESLKRIGTKADAIIPLMVGGEVIGCITSAMVREAREVAASSRRGRPCARSRRPGRTR